MTTSLRHRRRAERFAQLLDEASGGRRQRRRNPLDEELADLVALRHQLVVSTPAPEIDPEFRAGLRAMLVATAEREGIGATAAAEPAEPSQRRTRTSFARPSRAPRARTAVIAGVAVGAVAFTGMSTASENAMPGDALYGVKRSTERAQLALASSDVGRGALYLSFAQTRLAEARLLGGDLGRVLDDMDRDATQGVKLLTIAATSRQDHAALAVIDEFVAEQRTALDSLAGQLAGADATRAAASLELLDEFEERTGELRDELDECGGSTPATTFDSLGPLPQGCVALPPPSTIHLEPGLTAQPDQPSQSQPGGGAPAEPGTTDGSGPVGGDPTEETDDPAGTPPAEPTGEASPPSPDEDPAVTGEDAQTDDGGLLSGINRLLGNLLGG